MSTMKRPPVEAVVSSGTRRTRTATMCRLCEEDGLQRLASVLKPTGGMLLMLYGELGRTGIYHFHEMVRHKWIRSFVRSNN